MENATLPTVENLSQKLDFEERGHVARVGLLLLATDLTTEREVARVLHPEGIATHAARLPYENPTTPETLREMGPRLGTAAELLAPVAPLRSVYYSCTAGTVTLGRRAVVDAVQAHLPGAEVVTPPDAAIVALSALGCGRVALLTPYLPETTRPMVAWFAAHGVELVRAACLGLEDDRDMAHLSRSSIVEAAVAADTPEADGLFISCTALPAMAAVDEIEARLGKPVVTSNQAALWLLRGHAGRMAPLAGHGRLFSLPAPQTSLRATV